MDWLKRVFSGGIGLDRVSIAGLVVMLAGILIVVFAKRIAARFFAGKGDNAVIVAKLAGVVVCAAGALIAIYA